MHEVGGVQPDAAPAGSAPQTPENPIRNSFTLSYHPGKLELPSYVKTLLERVILLLGTSSFLEVRIEKRKVVLENGHGFRPPSYVVTESVQQGLRQDWAAPIRSQLQKDEVQKKLFAELQKAQSEKLSSMLPKYRDSVREVVHNTVVDATFFFRQKVEKENLEFKSFVQQKTAKGKRGAIDPRHCDPLDEENIDDPFDEESSEETGRGRQRRDSAAGQRSGRGARSFRPNSGSRRPDMTRGRGRRQSQGGGRGRGSGEQRKVLWDTNLRLQK